MPKDNTPVPGVIPGAAPIPAANTKSLAFSSSGNKVEVKETQPLVIPEDVKWTPPQTVKPKTRKGFMEGQKALVTFVQDGDTASLTTKGDQPVNYNCRLDRIDAPETENKYKNKPAQAGSKESTANLEKLIGGKEVSVSVSYAEDEFNRRLCQIEIDGVDVSLKQVQDGMAWLYKKYGNPAEFNQAEGLAQYEKRGVFSDPKAIHPRRYKQE